MKRAIFTGLACLLLAVSLNLGIPIRAEAASGTCGDNITWVYEDTVLTISGQGEMDIDSHAPWYDCYKTCKKVVIEEGITNVASNAFGNFSQMKEVSLPTTVTALDSGCFDGCYRLANISLTHITSLGSMVFEDCDSLTEVTIHAGIKEIPFGAFRSCDNLSKLTIASGVTTVDDNAFADCRSLTEVTLPDSVTVLGGGAFSDCDKLKKVTLSKNITEMGGNVFQDCLLLESIAIPDKVPTIGGYAFEGCTNLRSITLGAGVKEIKETAFWRCPNLKSFTLSSANGHFLTDKGVLYTKDKSTLIMAPPGFSGSYTVLSGTKTVGAYSFYECVGLTDVIIPDSVTVIDEYAFDWCSALKTVKLGSKVENIRTYAFARTALTTVTLPASVRNVGNVAFAGCYSLKEVIFRGKMPIFHDYTFLDVRAKCYHNGDASWKNMGDYGGSLTWVAVNCNDNHTVVTQPGKAATCDTEGLTEGSYCSVCGQVLKEQTTIGASHSYGSWTVITPATTQTEGKSQRTCSVCNKTEEKTVPKLTPESTEETMPQEKPSETTAPATTPETEATEPAGTEATAPASQTQDTQKKIPTKWIILPIVAIVVIADVAAVLLYLKKRKK